VTDRREFLKSAAVMGGALITGLRPAAAAPQPIRMLVLGGTGFIGPHLVRHAVSRGHDVTIFTRGRRQADLPPGVTRLIGDRNGQLEALAGGTWDAVIDDSATNPEWVRQSTAMLRPAVRRYLFTSSTGVYYPYLTRGVDESVAPHLDVADPNDGSETYGVNKARCERLVLDTFGEQGTVVRPTYIVGPGDTSDRFPYWPVRLERGGEVLAPGRQDDPVAFIDVRDLAEFMVRLVEQQRSGVYNVVGPRSGMTTRRFYEEARAAINPAATLTCVDDYEFLSAHGIEDSIPWVMLKGNDFGHQSVRNDRAVAAGLAFRPLETTIRDTLAWWPTVPEARRQNPRFSIKPDQEARALADWHARG
jgi:2'-hydroxyisoflavone reductase